MRPMTISERFKEVAQLYARHPAQYWKQGAAWRFLSYGELIDLVDRLSAGLSDFGLAPGTRAMIMSENRPEWLQCDLALNNIGAITVPVDGDLDQDILERVMRDAECAFIFVSRRYLSKAVDARTSGSRVRIICFDKVIGGDVFFDDFKKSPSGLPGVSRKAGVATIVQTSGTTGERKAISLTDANLLHEVDAIREAVKIYRQDKFVSLLNPSDIFGRVAGGMLPILNGCSIAYIENQADFYTDLQAIKPTVVIAVPKILERIHEKALSAIERLKGWRRKFFFYLMSRREGFLHDLFADRFLHRRVRAVFGSRLRLVFCGGSTLDDRIIRFFRPSGLDIIDTYGLAEAGSVVSACRIGGFRAGTVGKPLPGVEVKIAPDKEILVRGGNVSVNCISEDGWLHTGDLGLLSHDYFLTVSGRKIDMIISREEHVVYPEKIEAMLDLSPYISWSFVAGFSQGRLSALIVPDKEIISERLNGQKIDVHGLIEGELQRLNHHLPAHQKIGDFILLKRAFDLEHGELTPNLKLIRENIRNNFQGEIAGLLSR